MTFAPIALFVYNRPAHTRQTVEALKKNALAKDSDLIIFSDAAKSESQAETVREVRQYIHQIDGFKSVTIVERDKNFGLARSIIDGVTSVVNERGRIIVLEDDLIVTPHFLDFMNRAVRYAHEEKVMQISANMFPISSGDGYARDIFLQNDNLLAITWDRAWRKFEPDADVDKDDTAKKPERIDMGYFIFTLKCRQGAKRTLLGDSLVCECIPGGWTVPASGFASRLSR